MLANLRAMPGRYARLLYYRNNQRQTCNLPLVPLADLERAQRQLAGLRAAKPQLTHYEIWTGPDVTKASCKLVAPAQPLDATPTPLAGPAATPPTEPMFSNLPAVVAPAPAQRPVVVSQNDAPPGVDHMSAYLLQLKERSIYELREQLAERNHQLREVETTVRTQKEKIDELQLDLKYKDREHELSNSLAAAQAAQESKPTGLGALPAPMLEGLMGLAAKMLGLGGAAGLMTGTDAGTGATEVTGQSEGHRQLLTAICELVPTEELAAQVYAVLAKLLPTPHGIQQLLQLAGLAQPQPTPQYAN